MVIVAVEIAGNLLTTIHIILSMVQNGMIRSCTPLNNCHMLLDLGGNQESFSEK